MTDLHSPLCSRAGGRGSWWYHVVEGRAGSLRPSPSRPLSIGLSPGLVWSAGVEEDPTQPPRLGSSAQNRPVSQQRARLGEELAGTILCQLGRLRPQWGLDTVSEAAVKAKPRSPPAGGSVAARPVGLGWTVWDHAARWPRHSVSVRHSH